MFLPDYMSPQEIVDAINEVYGNRKYVENTFNTYKGVSNTGIGIEMYLDMKSEKIISAFPKLRR